MTHADPRVWAGLVTVGAIVSSLSAQIPVDPATISRVRATIAEGGVAASNPIPASTPVFEVRVAPLGPGVPLADGGGSQRAVDLYNGILTSGNSFWRWTSGSSEVAYWALDDGRMGPAGAAAGGAHVREYEFTFGVHADFNGDIVRPYVIVSFYQAPADPIAGATNPVVEPPAPVSSIGWIFNPLTLPTGPGFYSYRSGLIDLAALGLDFDVDEDYYVEILPVEWSSYPAGAPVVDPDVQAIFAGNAAMITYGSNQNGMWSDFWHRDAACGVVYSDNDGLYDQPAELDACNSSTFRNQSAMRLRGDPCANVNALRLDIDAPADVCVKPGEPVTVTLSQACLPGLVRGYQAFLEFTPGRLNFSSGSYVTPMPYGLPILDPITAVGANLDLAAGINDLAGQAPTSSSAALATLNFTAGATEGLTQVVFRTHAPPARFSDPVGAEVVPILIDSQTICVDGTPPSITFPPLNVQCFADIPAPAADYAEFAAQGGVAVDNGCYGPVAPTVTFESYIDNGGGGCPGIQYIMERTYRATDCAGNYSECVQTITVVDNTPPTVSAGTIGYCYPSVAAAEAAAIAATTYSDNCTPAGSLVVAASTTGTCSAIVTVSVTDACSNSASVGYSTRIDSTAPAIGGSIAGGSLNATCGATIPVSVTMTDNCGILASAVGFSMSTTSGAINAGGLVKAQVNATTVTISGDATLTDVVTCAATVSISITGADECGDPAPAFSVSGVWSDTSAPVVNAGADPPPYPADAGGCTAFVSWTAATATDNCPTTFTTVYDIDEGDNGSIEITGQVGTTHVFPVGTHRVTARVSDGCGNEGTDYFLVTVLPVNELVVSVELGWTFTGTRCTTFDLWNCPGATPAATVSQVLVFTGGMAASQVVLVPCASGPYECITARDRLHTLRQTDEDFGVVGTQYVADFTGDDKLIGGNLNDDYWIDILDFGVFSYQWGVHYDSNGDAIYDANTTCSTPYPHAEINGTDAGLYPTTVYTDDFTFIQQNYLMHHEANCCGQAGLQGNDGRMIYVAEGGSGPITSIPVAELIARGMGELSAGDLNRDGVLDMLDIIAFVTGARPSVDEPVPAAPPARVAPESAPIRMRRP